MSKKELPKKEQKERQYQFTEHTSETESRTYVKKESELSQKEIDVLLGNLVKDFNSCPRKAQEAFIQLLVNESKAVTEVPKVKEKAEEQAVPEEKKD